MREIGGAGMIFGQPRKMVLDPVQGGRRENTALSHHAAEPLAYLVGAVNHFVAAGQDGARRCAESLENETITVSDHSANSARECPVATDAFQKRAPSR